MRVEFTPHIDESDEDFMFRIQRAAKNLKLDIFPHKPQSPMDVKHGVTCCQTYYHDKLLPTYQYTIDE